MLLSLIVTLSEARGLSRWAEMLRCAQHDNYALRTTVLYLPAVLWQGERLPPMVILSEAKGRHVMQWMAQVLALGVYGVVSLEAMVQRISTSMATGCPVNVRQKQPAA